MYYTLSVYVLVIIDRNICLVYYFKIYLYYFFLCKSWTLKNLNGFSNFYCLIKKNPLINPVLSCTWFLYLSVT